MASEIKANKISPATGTAFTLGDSGDTFTLPSGATLSVPSGATLSGAGAITVPSGGSLTIDSGATITNNGTGSGFGKILNVWHALQTTSASVGNTTTYQNISQLYFTVTPQSTNSKFYMSYHWSGDNTTQGTGYGSMACFRDATNIGGVSIVEVGVVMMSGSVYDAPATTSSITYRPKVWYDAATVNYGGAASSPSFFLMEVDG
jgi:hypothetical protein